MTHSLTASLAAPPLEKLLRPGWYLYWQKQIFQLTALNLDSLLLEVINIATDEPVALSLDTLLTGYQDGEQPLLAAPSLAALRAEIAAGQPHPQPADERSLPASLLARADDIIKTVEMVEQRLAQAQRQAQGRGEPFRRTESLQRVVQQLETPLAWPTFYKYRRLYQQSYGDRAQLAASLRRSTFNQSKASPATLHFLDTLILRYYARKRSIRPATLYRLAQSVMKRTGCLWLDPDRCAAIPQDLVEELLDAKLPMPAILDNVQKRPLLIEIDLPSRSWFYAYLRWFENQPDQGQHVITERYGREVWEHEHLVFDTYVTRAAFPLQYVFADHCLLDVFIVDEATRSQLDRLWLTLLIDAYSRSIVGLALLYETPGILSIQSALQHAIWPKTSHKAHGLQQEWVCFGIPQQLSLDNAWAHHAHSLENLARLISQNGRYHSIDLLFRPPYRGRYGALVERFFGNLAGQIKEHLLGAFPPGEKRPIRSADREACLLYQDIDWFIHQAIVTYQHTVHSELGGLTPHEKWVAGMQAGIPLVPSATAAMQRLFWRMNPSPRIINSKGICAFGLDYWSPDLSRAERVGKNGQPVPFNFHYDPADISCLALFRDGAWVGDVYAKQLRQPDGSLYLISLAERQLAQKMARQAGQSPRDWLRYIQEIDELNQTRQRERQAARRHAPNGPARLATEAKDMESALGNLSTTASYQTYTDLLTAFLGEVNHEKR
jgi:hypothetical protein